MFCHRCGNPVRAEIRYCPNCGQPLPEPAQVAAMPVPVWPPATGIEAMPGRWFGEGWRLVQADLGNYLLISLLFFLLNGVPFIQGALIAGFHIYTIKKLAGRNPDIADIFKGFKFFGATLIASFLITLFTFLGTLALIIPGLVIAAMYKFTYLFIVDKRMDFWPAMKASHNVVRNDYFGFTMFLIAAFLINVLGFLCLVVGLMVTVPLTFAAITAAYRDLVGFDRATIESL
jgi:uncharacterized membrane protein